ncbi:hypothetical protein [Bradyrhizobium zhanjiangense]|uniref:hypothetical protein n=1 Tax=Bradyrhizobium zhanjiangense TaxID=1325107 RepID=UPI001009D298|nr:hypothetical protein [Bradyrhizobium zhanjiangense]
MNGVTIASKWREQLTETRLLHVMGAHIALSAKLAEEASFDAIPGLPQLPIVADIHIGFGNAINVTHAIAEYERASAANEAHDRLCLRLTRIPQSHSRRWTWR